MQISKKFLIMVFLSTLLYGNNLVLQVQTQLKELGYNPGIIDGVMGAQTADAIRTYQEEYGLNVTGRATKSLLKHLDPSLDSADEAIYTSVESQKSTSVQNSTKQKSFELPNFLSVNNTVGNKANDKIYVGVGYGQASVKFLDTNDDFSDLNVLKIFGGYKITNYIGIEGGYASFGEMKISEEEKGYDVGTIISEGSAEITGIELAVIGNFPINKQFSIFGKVGVLKWENDIKYTETIKYSGDLSDKVSRSYGETDVFFGFGGTYNVSKKIGLRASWERYELKKNDADGDTTIELNLLSVSAVYSF